MDVSAAAWVVILAAVLAANLPFFSEHLFACIPLRAKDGVRLKAVWFRLLELFVLYFAVGFLAQMLEQRIGTVFPQKWEFYAVSACLFLVFAFPGFVFRYLRKSARA